MGSALIMEVISVMDDEVLALALVAGKLTHHQTGKAPVARVRLHIFPKCPPYLATALF